MFWKCFTLNYLQKCWRKKVVTCKIKHLQKCFRSVDFPQHCRGRKKFCKNFYFRPTCNHLLMQRLSKRTKRCISSITTILCLGKESVHQSWSKKGSVSRCVWTPMSAAPETWQDESASSHCAHGSASADNFSGLYKCRQPCNITHCTHTHRLDLQHLSVKVLYQSSQLHWLVTVYTVHSSRTLYTVTAT